MKFLLVGINAKYIHSTPGIYSLKAYAEGKTSIQILTAEYTINQQIDFILGDIVNRKPDAVGFSCYIWNIEQVEKLLNELHKLLPGTDIYLGGPEASYNADTLRHSYPFLKEIMIGEGERRFLEILQTYEKSGQGDTPEDKQRPEGGQGRSMGLLSMDEIPFFYEKEEEDFNNRIIYYESQRGCPFRCSYCLSSIDKNIRYRGLDLVKKDLLFFLDKGLPQVKFVDRTFNCNHARTTELLKFLRENDNGVTNFHFEIAGDILTDEEIKELALMRPGAVQLEIGVQTTNPQTLKAINRPCDLDRLKKNVAKLRENNNIHLHLDLIAGLPYEDMNSFINSFNQVFDMKPNQLQLGFLKLLKGTQINEDREKWGIVARDYPPYEVLYTDFISFEELKRLKGVEEMVELYYNSGQFITTLPLFIEKFATPFAFFDALADYYEEKGYFFKSPARSRKYEILLEFAGEKCSKDETLMSSEKADISNEETDVSKEMEKSLGNAAFLEDIRDALTMDYYLREKPKSKPDFVHRLPKAEFDYEHRDPLTGNFYLKLPAVKQQRGGLN